MKKYKGIFAGLVIAILFITGTAFASDKFSILKDDFSELGQEDFMKVLADKSFDELIDDLNVLGEKVNTSDLIFYADALTQKSATLPEGQLMREIMDDSNTDSTKTILLQLNRFLGNENSLENNEKLREMLSRDDVDFEVKRNILINFHKDFSEDTDLLEKLSIGKDDRLAFHALKMLNTIDSQKAIEIANDILQNYEICSSEKVRAAIKIKAIELNNAPISDEKRNFIKMCDDILSKNNDELMIDTVAFALSNLMDKDAILFIISNDRIDREIKCFCIDKNYPVLKSMLTENVSDENIKIITEAMLIYPLKEMAEPLNSIKSVLSARNQSSESVKQVESALQLIQERGKSASGK